MKYDSICVSVQWEKDMDGSLQKGASLLVFIYLTQLT